MSGTAVRLQSSEFAILNFKTEILIKILINFKTIYGAYINVRSFKMGDYKKKKSRY